MRCSKNNEVKAVFLPLGDSSSDYKLIIKAKARYKGFVIETTITTQVGQKNGLLKEQHVSNALHLLHSWPFAHRSRTQVLLQ